MIIASSSSSTKIPTVTKVQPDTDMVRQLLLWNGHDSKHLLRAHGRNQLWLWFCSGLRFWVSGRYVLVPDQ